MGEIGDGTGSNYPGAIATNYNPEVNAPAPNKTLARKEVVEDLAAEIIATQTILGTNPQGSVSDVKTFLQTEHNTNGSHNTSLVANLASNQTFTGQKQGLMLLRGTSNLRCAVASATTCTITSDYVVAAKVGVNYNTYFKYLSGSTLTIDTAVTGANGKDAALSADSWVHIYIIVKSTDGTTAGTASNTGPLAGPQLPTGYDRWAYCGAFRFDGSSNFIPAHIMGNTVYYEEQQHALTDGTEETSEPVDLAAFVPPNAPQAILNYELASASNAARSATIEHVTGTTFMTVGYLGATTATEAHGQIIFPLTTAQTMYYLVSGNQCTLNLYVVGYIIPNGAN